MQGDRRENKGLLEEEKESHGRGWEIRGGKGREGKGKEGEGREGKGKERKGRRRDTNRFSSPYVFVSLA